MKKLSVLVVGAWVLINAWPVWALERAPLNPEFLQRQEQLQANARIVRTGGGHPLGYMPSPFKPPQLSASPAKVQAGSLLGLPSHYDLRTIGKVSPVKDQGNFGNCWAFSTFGSMESCLLPGASWDFSENNLANQHGFDSGYGYGGDFFMALAYLGRWSGPVLESDDPYSNGPYSPSGLPVQKHIQSAQFISERTSATDNDNIKQAIMTYGGLSSAFYYDNACYNTNHFGYYYNWNKNSNHAITLVGWDDNFSHTNFNLPYPPADGAFLVKNSWGTSWGDAGYFWISYDDTRIGQVNCLFLNAESTTNYDSIYQYDTLGLCTAVGYNTTTAWGANIFSGSSGTIQAVSFYAPSDGASYEVRVYTGGAARNPIGGTLRATKMGTLAYAGYYTVVLDSPVTYSTRFSAVVKLTTPGNMFPIPAEYPIPGYSSAATASAGHSYMSSDGTSWEEAHVGSTYFNVCIKAFGTGGDVPMVGPLIRANGQLGQITVARSNALSITVQLDPGNWAGTPVDWWVVACANSSWYYLNHLGQWPQFDGSLHCHPANQGPLVDLPATTVLDTTDLQVGSYTFWFAISYPMSGILNLDGPILVDSVHVTVQ